MQENNKNKSKKKTVVLVVISLVLALSIGFFIGGGTSIFKKEVIPWTPLIPAEIPDTKINLVAVGDNLIHGPIYRAAKANGENGEYNFKPCYSHVEDYIKNASIAMINQESPLGGNQLGISSYPNFNTPQEMGDDLIAVGFDVISHANNHILDKGIKGLRGTLDFWEQRKDQALMIGVYKNQEEADKCHIVEVDGIKIAFLAYTYGMNGYRLPPNVPEVIGMIDKEKIAKDVAKAEEEADVTVVSIHWGQEYQLKENSFQDEIAQYLADLDVDLIIGSHPHVIQPMEMLTQKDGGQAICIYSLGNFVSGQNIAKAMIGGMVDIEIIKDGETGEISLGECKFLPIITHYGANHNNPQPYFFKDYTEELAKVHGIMEKDPVFSYSFCDKIIRETISDEFLYLE